MIVFLIDCVFEPTGRPDLWDGFFIDYSFRS